MRRILRLSVAVIATMAASCGLAAADDVQSCVKDNGQPAIDACTRAINSGQHRGATLSILYINRGAVYRDDMNKPDLALADYDAALRIDPKQPTIYNNRAKIAYDRGNYDSAITDFDRAIALDRMYTAAYTNRGLAHEKKNNIAKARADYNQALAVPAKLNDGEWAQETARARLKALGGR